jgi:hypothetical protein
VKVFLASADYPFLGILWTMLVVFAWVIWFWLLITIFSDLFRRRDIGGWAKAGWMVLVIVLPFIGVLIYMISQGRSMADRQAERVQADQQQFDQYVRTVASDQTPTSQIEKAKSLLDSGSITKDEYEEIKRRTIATA